MNQVIHAQQPTGLHDETAVVIGGVVECHGDCDITATGQAIIHAHDRTRVTVGERNRHVMVYAHDNAEVEADSGTVFADGWARVFLSGNAVARADERALVIADGRSTVILAGGAPTLRQISARARVEVGDHDVDHRTAKTLR